MSSKNNSLERQGISHNSWIDQISCYIRHYPEETRRIASLLKFKNSDIDLYDRKTLPGHITASGIVVEGGKILMIFHSFLRKWLQPGGHVEREETPLEAAKRETLEETGISVVAHAWHEQHVIPFDINIHPIPENNKKREPPHLHYDFRYLLQVDECGDALKNNSHEFSWRDLCGVEEENLILLIEKLRSQKLM